MEKSFKIDCVKYYFVSQRNLEFPFQQGNRASGSNVVQQQGIAYVKIRNEAKQGAGRNCSGKSGTCRIFQAGGNELDWVNTNGAEDCFYT